MYMSSFVVALWVDIGASMDLQVGGPGEAWHGPGVGLTLDLPCVDLAWTWRGAGVDLEWSWPGPGVDLEWTLCGAGVNLAWTQHEDLASGAAVDLGRAWGRSWGNLVGRWTMGP